jgi:phage recombination protein Bet
MNAIVQHTPQASNSVLVRMAQRYGVDPEKMVATLKATAFRGDVSNEQLMALCVVADQYKLNPWTKEIYAFPSQGGAIVPIVGVDGWSRIINSDPQFDGMDFTEGELDQNQIPVWIECRMYRKDRSHAIATKEYFKEVDRNVGPWKTHPRRMLRHKAMIQAARLAFGFVGIYDQDEAERVIEVEAKVLPKIDPRGDLSEVDMSLRDKWVDDIKSILDQDKEEEAIAAEMREVAVELNKHQELYICVLDELAKRDIITKKNFKKLTALLMARDEH